MRLRSPLIAAAMAAGFASLATAAAATVQVRLGPAVQARQRELGGDELADQAVYLRRDVERALAAHGEGQAVQAQLTIQDIQPNMPTSAQLGRSPGLNAASRGLGGAAISGEVTTTDGRRVPVRFRWFQEEPRNELNFTTWGDADEAFDRLADAIRAGRPPDDTSTWPPPRVARTVTGTLIP